MTDASRSDEKGFTTAEPKSASAVEIDPIGTQEQPSDEYFQAVGRKIRAWPRQKGNDTIRALLRQNLFRTRAMLYKDYINYHEKDALADQTQMQLNIDQYSMPAISKECCEEADNV
jgi:hypothetical protein